MLHTFLDISLPSLHDYDLKIPNMYFHITFYRDVNQQQRDYLSFSELANNSWKFNSKRLCLHLTK